jgi:hypothetical protein
VSIISKIINIGHRRGYYPDAAEILLDNELSDVNISGDLPSEEDSRNSNEENFPFNTFEERQKTSLEKLTFDPNEHKSLAIKTHPDLDQS